MVKEYTVTIYEVKFYTKLSSIPKRRLGRLVVTLRSRRLEYMMIVCRHECHNKTELLAELVLSLRREQVEYYTMMDQGQGAQKVCYLL